MPRHIDTLRMAFGGRVADTELQRLARDVTEWEAEPGEDLVRDGSVAPQGFVIVHGSATVRVDGQAVARLGPGSCIWVSDSPEPSVQPARVTADERTWVLVVAAPGLATLRERLSTGDEDTARG